MRVQASMAMPGIVVPVQMNGRVYVDGGVADPLPVDVLIESKENEDGLVSLSKEKADKLKVWDEISAACERDELIEGTITQRVKGGLAVDIARAEDSLRRAELRETRAVVDEIYTVCDRKWRGIGTIPASGWRLSDRYADFDAVYGRRFAHVVRRAVVQQVEVIAVRLERGPAGTARLLFR